MRLEIKIDSASLVAQLIGLKKLLEKIPKRAAKRFARKAFRLVHGGIILERVEPVDSPTETPDVRIAGCFRINIAGLDELICAAARRAAKFDVHGGSFHGFGCGVETQS